MPRTSERNSSDRDRDVGLLQAGGGEDVDHAFRRHRPRDDLAHGMLQLVFRARLGRLALAQNRLHGLEKRHVIADANRVFVRHGERERT